jgi:hypothetical protein
MAMGESDGFCKNYCRWSRWKGGARDEFRDRMTGWQQLTALFKTSANRHDVLLQLPREF